MPYEYHAKVTNVVDGDTINVKDLHFKNRKRLIDEGKIKMSYKDAGL